MKLCEDMKTFSNGSIIIRSTFSQKMCLEKAWASAWPQCLAKDSLGQQLVSQTFSFSDLASPAPGRGASQPGRCFCKNFWLPQLPKANVCLLQYVNQMLLCENTC